MSLESLWKTKNNTQKKSNKIPHSILVSSWKYYTEPCKAILQPWHRYLYSTHQKVTMSATERYVELTQTILYKSSKATENPQTGFQISGEISDTLIIHRFVLQHLYIYISHKWHLRTHSRTAPRHPRREPKGNPRNPRRNPRNPSRNASNPPRNPTKSSRNPWKSLRNPLKSSYDYKIPIMKSVH